jgi:hypothetical protein
MVPRILLVLSLINFLLAAPVVLQELAPSVGEPPADQALAANSPRSPQTGTSTIQDVASPEINKLPPSGESYLPSDGSARTDLASNEGGSGSSTNHPLSNGPEIVSPGTELKPFPNPWNSHDWSDTSSEFEPEPKKNFMSEAKSFFDKLVSKCKFWRRGGGALNAAQRELQGTTR